MATPGRWHDVPAGDLSFSPQIHPGSLPVEVLDRGEVLRRLASHEATSRQRVDFHQLVVCTDGSGRHEVDFEPIWLHPGSVLRTYPGQVQRLYPESAFDAVIVIWPVETRVVGAFGGRWYPGSDLPIRWQVDRAGLDRLLGWIDDVRTEQERFDRSARHGALLESLLTTLLLRFEMEIPDAPAAERPFPEAYRELRELMEERLRERPAMAALAAELGYSVRTLDRACHQAVGRTARAVLDDRIALEARRLLTHSDLTVSEIAADLGFSDSSNFARFVKRQLGAGPSVVRGRDAADGQGRR
ncbi:MAG: helix-turn-helix domain-containing protein [Actinomycetota bacterium]